MLMYVTPVTNEVRNKKCLADNLTTASPKTDTGQMFHKLVQDPGGLFATMFLCIIGREALCIESEEGGPVGGPNEETFIAK